MWAKTNTTAILVLVMASSQACFVRRRTVVTPPAQANRPLLTASKEELIQRIHNVSDPIQSFIMRADLSPTVINQAEKAATDYATIGAYLLFRRPDELRVVGQDPVIESTIFDMASIGNEFHLNLPRQKKFVIGRNDSPGTSENKLANMRPTAFLSALMIDPPDPATEQTLMEDDTGDDKAVYILLIVRKNQDQLWLARNVYFDRYTLEIARQKTFDPAGNLVSETRYSSWTNYDGHSFPSFIDIRRLRDNYEVQLSLTTIRINAPEVTADKFVLTQPPGSELQQLK
jgi:hypothetical protein